MPEELYTKKEYESLLLKILGRTPALRIIDFFMDNPFSGFTKREAIEALGMDKQKFHKHFEDLEELGIVKVSKSRKTVLYKIDMQHPLVKGLYKMVTQASLKIAREELEKMNKAAIKKNPRLAKAIELYKQGEVSLGKAAEIANMGIIEFKEKLKGFGITRTIVAESARKMDRKIAEIKRKYG